ncbi:MAG: DUF481 domain-containing protein [Polyangiaceae bacterium]|nr:DUF481 domain-containing protein [Polyangiaceae bacterium]
MNSRHITLTAIYVLALCTTLRTTTSLAQVNIEAVRGDANRRGVSGRVETSFTGSTGNSQGIVSSGSGRLQLKYNPHLAFIHATGSYTRLNRTTSAERGLVHVRYNYRIIPRVWGEAFTQIEHDAFRRLTYRELVGIGPRFQIIAADHMDLFAGTSYMAGWEKLAATSTIPSDSVTLYHRWNNYLALSASITDRLETGTTIYFQPRFDKPSDWLLLFESFLEVGITGVISTKISATLRHNSTPPEDVKTTDLAITNAFSVKF